jgi:cellulose synthase (UDP-forming)
VALNVAGVLIAVPRLLFWNDFEAGTVAINLAWTLFNLALLGVVLGVAAETRQVRARPRVAKTLPARLHLPDGRILECEMADFSMSGARLTLPESGAVALGTAVRIGLADRAGEALFEARAVFSGDGAEGFEFIPMPLEVEMRYVQCTFARTDVWHDWSAAAAPDRPLASLAEVLSFGAAGYGRVVQILYTELAGRLRRILRRPAAAAL